MCIRDRRMDGTEQIAFQTHADCSRQAGRLSSGGAPRADWSLKGRRCRLAIGRQLADRLQRVPWSAGGDVVDARARLDTNRVRQVRAGTGDWSPVGWAACAGLRKVGDDTCATGKDRLPSAPPKTIPYCSKFCVQTLSHTASSMTCCGSTTTRHGGTHLTTACVDWSRTSILFVMRSHSEETVMYIPFPTSVRRN